MVSLIKTNYDNKLLYTYFGSDGRIVKLPTLWCASMSNGLSPKSVEEYSKVIKYYLVFLEQLPEANFTSLDDLIISINDKRQLLPFIEFQKKSLSPNTINSREAILKEFFNFTTTEEAGTVKSENNNPYRSGKLISRSSHKNIYKMVTSSDLIKLLKGYHNEAERCLVHFLFCSGLRISETINLQREHLPDINSFPEDTQYYKITVPGAKGVAGNIKYREAIISAPVLKRILMYHQSFDYRFSGKWKDKPKENQYFCRLMVIP